MQDESSRRYLFVAIDRATRWGCVQLKANKTAASAQGFLKALHVKSRQVINALLEQFRFFGVPVFQCLNG